MQEKTFPAVASREIPLSIPVHAHFFRWAILTRKVRQNDLVFGVRSRFISRSVCAILQVSVCSTSITNCATQVNTHAGAF